MQKESSKGRSDWKEPAEQWIPREIRARLTEVETLVAMLKDLLGNRNEPTKR